MNRYSAVFSNLKNKKETAFIPFACAGDPNMQVSEKVFKTYIDAGADILEIGYPFSDPIADGPVNQRAGIRSINAGLDHKKFFQLIDSLRSYSDIPMGVLCYANTVIHLGVDSFCRRASDAGLDSILVADLPPEEASPLLSALDKYNLQSVFIVSELTPVDRLKHICSKVTGFVYVVSRLGPTGIKSDLQSAVKKTLARLKKNTNKPLCVGFGLSQPDHIKQIKKAGADGAIVGSALVKRIESGMNKPALLMKTLAKDVKAYKKATLA